ncbi:flavodoxin family protein [Williamsia sterculiae]|uniref:Multimeric flavodoxin WrbA n=1 Tax=Williamsia sterculiae TaxID=1344003 RepID=A0A1N7FX21_9NOCA|nr:NAD(P)H-dependent oxidoreductase [Williamsia sterculiae]SIS04859.1 Multimeric flavodoxin WrbA [Williamsia sterculiae]
MADLVAVALVCSLKARPDASSSETIAQHVATELDKHDVSTQIIRIADFDVKPGVETNMGNGDDWPEIRAQVAVADILLIATPTWMGHMSSIAQRVLERLDAELSFTDSEGRPGMVGKVATVAVVGNEDGAHKIVADVFQALNDVGYSIPAQGCTYWNDEAMGSRNYIDLPAVPDPVISTTAALARNAAHLARRLRGEAYPPYA